MLLCAICAWAMRNRWRREHRWLMHIRSWYKRSSLVPWENNSVVHPYMALQCVPARTILPSVVISLITHIARAVSCLTAPSYYLWTHLKTDHLSVECLFMEGSRVKTPRDHSMITVVVRTIEMDRDEALLMERWDRVKVATNEQRSNGSFMSCRTGFY